MSRLKTCENCGRQFLHGKHQPYQKYCKVCKGKRTKIARAVIVPNDAIGLYIVGGKQGFMLGRLYRHLGGTQYWSYGKGFYRAWKSRILMKDGKEIGDIDKLKNKLKRVLKGKLDEKDLVA